MATQVAKQAAIRARRPAVSAGIPILAAKITAPGMPDWALMRPRVTKLIAEGNRWCPLYTPPRRRPGCRVLAGGHATPDLAQQGARE
jgi:hypothetical protein